MLNRNEAVSYIARVIVSQGEAAAYATAKRMADGAKAWFADDLFADAMVKAGRR